VTYIPRNGTNELLDQSVVGAEIEDKANERGGKVEDGNLRQYP
jgi:hypothetical protein